MVVGRPSPTVFNLAGSVGFIIQHDENHAMRLLSILGFLATLFIAVWTIEAVLALPGALAVSSGASLTLGVLIAVLAVAVGIGLNATRSRATTYW